MKDKFNVDIDLRKVKEVVIVGDEDKCAVRLSLPMNIQEGLKSAMERLQESFKRKEESHDDNQTMRM